MIQQQTEARKNLNQTLRASTRTSGPSLSSVNGTGFMLFDFRAREGGVYEATRWFTFFYFPLVPLSRLVVRPVDMTPDIMRRTYRYDILRKERLDPVSVLRTYGMALLAVVPLLFAFLNMDTVNRLVGSGPGFFVTLATIVWFVFMLTRFANADRIFKKGTGASA